MRAVLCECGDFFDESCKFKDYIKTSANPSTSTIGHAKCGFIFNFVDDEMPKRYSSKKKLKSLAMKFAEKNKLDYEVLGRFLIEVNRLKSLGTLSDVEILMAASINICE